MNIDPLIKAAWVAELCESAAWEIYGNVKPSNEYAQAVAQLLKGTVAHESDMFRHTRQIGFSWGSDSGAWGLAQCELGSVSDSIDFLRARPELAKRCAVWLADDKDADLKWLFKMKPEDVLRLLPVSDQLSILFMRLHYMRRPESVPRTLQEQDAYYKRFYNTSHGAAVLGDFTRALKRFEEKLR